MAVVWIGTDQMWIYSPDGWSPTFSRTYEYGENTTALAVLAIDQHTGPSARCAITQYKFQEPGGGPLTVKNLPDLYQYEKSRRRTPVVDHLRSLTWVASVLDGLATYKYQIFYFG